MKLNKTDFTLFWKKSHLRDDVTHQQQAIVDAPKVDVQVPVDRSFQSSFNVPSDKVSKLESLLFEKNKIIDGLQIQLDREKDNRKEFENVKTIMDEEIKHLREQLKAFRNYYKEKENA